jgi:hypothetical protein
MSITAKFQAVSSDRMSNKQYHAWGKPNWWLCIEGHNVKGFARLSEQTRGDSLLNCDAEFTFPAPGDYTVFTGVGPNNKHGIREIGTLRVYADGTTLYNPTPDARKIDDPA